ncbi:MAG: GatB/YqeY domain-containing protein [Propionibacteriaceae bacterium]|nr:GatB/YqeY domain-containing protein [Propionibacteriaceae bacterium]
MSESIAGAVPFGEGAAEVSVAAHGPLTLRIKEDLTAATRARDDAAKSSLRMALAALQNAEVAGAQAKSLSEADEIAVLTREARKREDAAQTYADAGRPESSAQEAAEALFLSKYLPQPLSDDEVTQLVDAEVARVSAELGEKPGMKSMGVIVKAVNAIAAGRADGGKIAALVRAQLG